MDIKRYGCIQSNENYNSDLINTLNEKQAKVKELKQNILTAWTQNKESEIEINQLNGIENEQQHIIKKNIEIISDLHIKIQISEEKYRSYVDEKDNQYKDKSERMIQEAQYNSTSASTLMKQLGLKLKMNHLNKYDWEIKFIFNESQELCTCYNVFNGQFVLNSLSPNHPKFDEIKQFLETTQDMSGLLYTIRKYFQKFQKK